MIFFKADKTIRCRAGSLGRDPAKNLWLQETRNISFEDLLQGRFVGMSDNVSRSHQHVLFVEYQNYIWVVPYVENEYEVFLKTAYPSRKYTRKYLGGN